MIRFLVLIPEKLIFFENLMFSLDSDIIWLELQRENNNNNADAGLHNTLVFVNPEIRHFFKPEHPSYKTA